MQGAYEGDEVVAEKVRKLEVFINPSWTTYGFRDSYELPDTWDTWSKEQQDAYVLELVMEEISDHGHNIVEESK